MKPVQPIIPGVALPVTNYAETQDEYQTLPSYRMEDGTVLTRWHLTWRERLRVMVFGDVYLWLMTFNRPLQPVMLQIKKPSMEGKRPKSWTLWRGDNGASVKFHLFVGDEEKQYFRPHFNWSASWGAPIRRLGFLPFPAFRLDD